MWQFELMSRTIHYCHKDIGHPFYMVALGLQLSVVRHHKVKVWNLDLATPLFRIVLFSFSRYGKTSYGIYRLKFIPTELNKKKKKDEAKKIFKNYLMRIFLTPHWVCTAKRRNKCWNWTSWNYSALIFYGWWSTFSLRLFFFFFTYYCYYYGFSDPFKTISLVSSRLFVVSGRNQSTRGKNHLTFR